MFVWGAAALALAGWADVSLKNVAETFFLKRVGVDYLPLAYLINSALLVGTTWATLWVAARSDRPRLLPKVFFGLAVLLIPLWLLVRAELLGAFGLLILASKQFQSISLLAYWLAIGDLLHGRQAKRLAAPMTAGYTLGSIFGSFASDPISQVIGIDGLLPVAAGAFVGSGLLTLPLIDMVPRRLELGSGSRSRPIEDREVNRSKATFGSLWADSKLFKLLLVASVANGLLGPMLYFQFQFVADQASAGEAGLLALFAQLRGWINVMVLVAQLFFASRLFRRIGIPRSIALSPLVYFVGFFGMSVRLSLPAGVFAFGGTTLQDSSVYDPAMKILFNLFPEKDRSVATGLLEGPAKRAGGALGNLICMGVIALFSPIVVGYVAIPITVAWLAASIALWRTYPALLLQASARRAHHGEEFEISEMIDPSTMKMLSGHLADSDPRPAIELIVDAPPREAAVAFAAAAREAPDETRPLFVAALDRVLEASIGAPLVDRGAAADLQALLEEPDRLSDHDRADVVQAFGRLADRDDPESITVLEDALADDSGGVRLAAAAALGRRGLCGLNVGDLDAALAVAVHSDDPDERRVAREELRAELLVPERGPDWKAKLGLLAELLARQSDRAATAEALAEVAVRHGQEAAAVREAMVSLKTEADPRVMAALLRYCGHAGLADQAPWLVEHVAHSGFNGARIRDAACAGLVALGSEAADVLLVELSFGKRSTRDAILPVIRQLEVEESTLRSLYERELQSIRRKLVHRLALVGEPGSSFVQQRLEERTDEGLHTALQLLAAIHDEDRIAELGNLLKRVGRSGAGPILFEALDSLLDPHEQAQLMPLMGDRGLELRARSAAAALGIAVPSAAAASRALLDEPDELTRRLAAATLTHARAALKTLAHSEEVEDHDDVLSPVEIALHLKSLPLFEGLTTRQLIDLADEVRELVLPADTVVVREGDSEDCLYLIVEGRVRVATGDTVLAELGAKDFFGEIAVLERERRTATCSTMTRSRLLRLDRNDLLRLMEELPAIAICICQTLSKRVRELTDRLRPGGVRAGP